MAVTAEKVPAARALEWGMVNRVVPGEALPEIARATALTLAAGPTLAYGLTKRAMYRSFGQDLEAALGYEAQLQEVASRSEDSHEGVSAFLDKREPRFNGR
jgi:2-(1,2-epoxy-1,2-dihydrophenyl)acetyl-CoA isomerase